MSDRRTGDVEGELPVVDPADVEATDGESGPGGDPPIVAGVLLAAGTGTRFEGDNKLLAQVEGEAIVARAARTLLSALPVVVAVVGHDADRVTAALAGVSDGRLAVVGNPDYREGQSTSVRAGLRAAAGADAVVVGLGDMPHVDPSTVEALLGAYRGGAGTALAAAVDGVRGNPVLFDATHFEALAAVEGDTGGRGVLLSAERGALLETGDPGVRRDVDEASDLRDPPDGSS
jgi:molybdenum cofactor cytidylyltransferase